MIDIPYNATRPIVAFDTETELFGPGNMAPIVSCFSFAWRNEHGEVCTELLDHDEGARELEDLLEQAVDGRITIAGHNLPYDVAVAARERPRLLELFFDAYEAGAVHCTQAAEWLNDTALGLLRSEWNEEKGEYSTKKSYSLENLARLHWGEPPYKDEWRMRYGELRGVPIRQWPTPAQEYPRKDAAFTLRLTESQREMAERIQPHNPLVASLAHVCRTYLALHLVAVWGEEIDGERASQLEFCMRQYAGSFVPDLKKHGLVVQVERGKNTGKLTKKKRPMQEMVAAALIEAGLLREDAPAFGGHLDPTDELLGSPADFLDDDHLTDGGKSGNRQVKCAADVLKDLAEHTFADADLAARIRSLAGFLEAEKLRTSFGAPLVTFGNGPLHSRYGFAETGRTTCSGGGKQRRTGLNVQQMPRKMPKALLKMMLELVGEELDVRSCYVPRGGWVQSSTDYNALEMVTFAQSCLWLVGHSTLAGAINEGVDPHTLFATDLLHMSYDDALAMVKGEDGKGPATDARQRSKVGNFGFPGGMGAKKFLKYAKAQGVRLTFAESKLLHGLYRQRWPESLDYFDLHASLIEQGGGSTTLVGLVSGMVRGDCGYTDSCNGRFQELAAFGATAALWRIVRECYDARLKTALHGSRVVAFIHDEFRAEHPEEAAHEAAERLCEVAVSTMQEVTPDVTVRAEPALSRRWYKAAKTVRDEHGRLQCWEPKEAA